MHGPVLPRKKFPENVSITCPFPFSSIPKLWTWHETAFLLYVIRYGSRAPPNRETGSMKSSAGRLFSGTAPPDVRSSYGILLNGKLRNPGFFFLKKDTVRSLVPKSEYIVHLQPDGTITYTNPAFAEFVNITAGQLVGKKYKPKIPDEDIEFVKKCFHSFHS